MRALVATGNQAAPLEMREVPEPVAAANECLVEVKAVSVNRGELRLLSLRPNGWRPGQDVAGVVARGAADGSGPLAGARVVGIVDQAGWSERVAAQTTRVAARAEQSGAEVTGTSRTTDLSSLEGPYDLILESVGGQSLTHSLKVVARDGVVVLYGNSSGQESTVSFANFAGHAHARLYAFYVYESGEPPTFGADLGILAGEIAAGRLKPHVGLEVSWRDPVGALDSLRERKHEGKTVLVVD